MTLSWNCSKLSPPPPRSDNTISARRLSAYLKGTVSREGYLFWRSKHFNQYFLCMLWWFSRSFTACWQNLPLVSLIPVAKLPPVSTTPAANLRQVSLITAMLLDLRISPRIFEKIWNGPFGILWGWGETDSWKNQKQKISWHCPFKVFKVGYWKDCQN